MDTTSIKSQILETVMKQNKHYFSSAFIDDLPPQDYCTFFSIPKELLNIDSILTLSFNVYEAIISQLNIISHLANKRGSNSLLKPTVNSLSSIITIILQLFNTIHNNRNISFVCLHVMFKLDPTHETKSISVSVCYKDVNSIINNFIMIASE